MARIISIGTFHHFNNCVRYFRVYFVLSPRIWIFFVLIWTSSNKITCKQGPHICIILLLLKRNSSTYLIQTVYCIPVDINFNRFKIHKAELTFYSFCWFHFRCFGWRVNLFAHRATCNIYAEFSFVPPSSFSCMLSYQKPFCMHFFPAQKTFHFSHFSCKCIEMK